MFDFFDNGSEKSGSNLNRVSYSGSGSKRRTSGYGKYIKNSFNQYVKRGNNSSSYGGRRGSSTGSYPRRTADSKYSPLYLFLYYLALVFWLEFDIRMAFSVQTFGVPLLTILMFSIPVAGVLFLITFLVPQKFKFLTSIVISLFLIVLFGSQIVYHNIFEVYYTMYQATTTGEALQFVDTIFSSILSSLFYIILEFIPFAALIIWGRRYFFDEDKSQHKFTILVAVLAIVLSHLSVTSTLKNYGTDRDSPYSLYYKTQNFDISVERIGLFTTMRVDCQRLITGFKEDADFIIPDNPNGGGNNQGGGNGGNGGGGQDAPEPVVYGDNVMNIDFNALAESASNKTIKNMHQYFASLQPTPQNEKTGLFKDCNLIWITAESFSPYVIRPEVTPMLYKMKTEGFNFTNFYSPLWSGSTLAGEFVLTTSLLPKNQDGIRSFRATIGHNMYFAMGNQARRLGYTTYAFHNNTYTYYGRDKTHPNLGYKYLGLGNGLKLEHPKYWPQSDVELMDSSVPYYIDEEHFSIYYMTVSGHCNYSYSGNRMSSKNRKTIESFNLGLSDTASAFISCNYEFELAMQRLMEMLEEKGIAEKTVIVIAPDHYPYELTHGQLEELAGHSIAEPFETYKSELIIYKKGMTPETVDTLCSSIDVLPTISNLLGIEYDSRLLSGKDIFSDHEEIVYCPSRNWMTTKGTYIAANKKFTPTTNEELPEDYVSRIKTIVSNSFTASQQIIDNDYYKVLFGKNPNS
ncbi:MAG: sulfatase-like hydrolase/transferase [Clostridia bacterium]|nr:sulfatase-like hydrolase/transferase [Clostridia bacterium]